MKILRYYPQFLRIFLGIIFMISGILKLFPIEPFELNFIDLGFANWYTAPIMSRLLIGLELMLGFFLIFNVLLKNFTLFSVLTLLIIFSIYLLLELIKDGNEGNCGCFGTYLQMTPLESIVKNVFLITITVFLLMAHSPSKNKLAKFLGPVLLVMAIGLPFILNPVDMLAAELRRPERVNFTLDLSPFTSGPSSNTRSKELGSGKQIVAFFSMTCPHCKIAALKMHVIFKRHPEIPFFMVLNGKEKNLETFLKETRTEDIPYMILLGEPFAKITGGKVPTIYWMQNGEVVKKSLYVSLEEPEILNWLADANEQ